MPADETRSWRERSDLKPFVDLPEELERAVDRLDQEFWISGEKLREIVKRFEEELDEGLQRDGANIPMNISWVHSLPTGAEKGTFLTLDLGGTNLRVCKVTLNGNDAADQKHSLEQEQYKLPQDLKTGSADTFWNYIAEQVEVFLHDKGLDKIYTEENPMALGFTFSYPATQHKIDHAVLQTWTKGFDIKGVEGHDVATQLREKLQQRKLPVELICVVNDTVGAMIASAYTNAATVIGAIFGTGCNAAYMSSLSSIKKLTHDDARIEAKNSTDGKGEGKMAINCEYGAFDNAHRVLPMTTYDRRIDAESPRPGEQAFEKMSAGLYLGEILRLIMLNLSQEKHLIFKNQDTAALHKPYSLDTGFLSAIENDTSANFTTTTKMFRDVLNLSINDAEIELLRRIAEIIAVRGARLCACGIAAICRLEGIKEGCVAADGSVANKHPRFKLRWAKAMGEILGWEQGSGGEGEGERPVRITSAEDGSGVGCAIIAAMELERRKKA